MPSHLCELQQCQAHFEVIGSCLGAALARGGAGWFRIQARRSTRANNEMAASRSFRGDVRGTFSRFDIMDDPLARESSHTQTGIGEGREGQCNERPRLRICESFYDPNRAGASPCGLLALILPRAYPNCDCSRVKSASLKPICTASSSLFYLPPVLSRPDGHVHATKAGNPGLCTRGVQLLDVFRISEIKKANMKPYPRIRQ